LVLLVTHEIDSAFWHEWNLFTLPGGIDLFLILNLVLLLLFLYGFEKVVKWEKGAALFSYLLAFSGIFAFVIHSYFILNDNPEFTSVISFGILLLTFVTSVAQIMFLILIKRDDAA
jgi:ABC-type transport system involved in cytochrome c biogenesis permease subunit